MGSPKELLSRGLGIIGEEMTGLETAAKAKGTREDPEDENSPIIGGLSGVQSTKLCSYMTTLRQLIDKDLDGQGVEDLPEEELIKLAAQYAGDNQNKGGSRVKPPAVRKQG